MYFKNVKTLVIGTFLSQLATVAFLPILTKLYSVEDFGVFSFFSSTYLLLCSFANARYDSAIQLPKNDDAAIRLIYIGSIITFSLVLLLYIGYLLLSPYYFADNNNYPENGEFILYAVLITFILFALNESMSALCIRTNKYIQISCVRVTKTSVGIGTKILLSSSLLSVKNGLIVGEIIAFLVSVLIYFGICRTKLKVSGTQEELRSMVGVAKEYSDFPKYNTASVFFSALTAHAPVFLLTSFYGMEVVGLYALARLILDAPIHLISGAMRDVYYRSMLDILHDNGDRQKFFLSTLRNLVILSAVGVSALYLLVEPIFTYFFSDEWISVVPIIEALAAMLALKFVANPLSMNFFIAKAQRELLIYHISILLFSTIGIYISHKIFNSYLIDLVTYSAINTIYYLAIILRSKQILFKYNNQSN